MSAQRVGVIFRQNLRLLLGDPGPLVVFIVTPLLVMAVLQPTQETVLKASGFPEANGAEQVVPGQTAMFAFFWLAFVGRTFFQEHGWGTWQRLQSSPASTADILIGKLAPAFVAVGGQMIVLFAIASVLFDFHSEGSVLLLLVIWLPLVLCVLSLTLALTALLKTMSQLDAASSLFMMLFASLGGSLVRLDALPDWADTISPAVPSHWVNKAAEDVILDGDGLSTILPSAGVLLGFAVLFGAIAVARFRVTDTKAIA